MLAATLALRATLSAIRPIRMESVSEQWLREEILGVAVADAVEEDAAAAVVVEEEAVSKSAKRLLYSCLFAFCMHIPE